ncbi:MAG: hypothetical protein WCG01_02245 [bacterium]
MSNLNCPQLKSQLKELKKLQSVIKMEIGVVNKKNIFDVQANLNQAEVLLKELKKQTPVSIERAKEIMGTREVLGPDEVKKAFGIEISKENIPAIQFSKEELIKAKELGQFLVLRSDIDREGQPLTMERVRASLLDGGYDESQKGKITYKELADLKELFSLEDFWQNDPIKFRWSLTSKEIIPASTDKNYFEQTRVLYDYVDDLFNTECGGTAIPRKFIEAMDEYVDYFVKNFKGKTDGEIQDLISGPTSKKYARELSALKINQLSRQTPAEVLYDIFSYRQNNDEKLLENTKAWTMRCDSVGNIVDVGNVDLGGASVYGRGLSDSRRNVGVVFSRS